MRFIFTILLLLLLSVPSMAQRTVVLIKIDGSINPATAEYIHRGIGKATDQKAECLVIELNTPGGLLKSTRNIVSDMLESEVPIVVYVAPGGAQAGSAGVFVTLAANIAAMAPGTNIGAAHPVGMQGQIDTVMNEKATNDAAAFIRSIAGKRKRNLAWAEESVRKSVSLSETEALDNKTIDLITPNVRDLLIQIDERNVETSLGTKTLHTKDARIISLDMGTQERLLSLLSDPNMAYILLLLGIYGIIFELYNPGAILPGIVGVISLVLAFYALHTLPINYAGLALIIFAIVLFLLEIKIVSHGMLAIGGIVSLLLGSIMLIRPGSTLEVARISWSVIITSCIVTSAFFLFVVGMGLKAQKQRPVTGIEGMSGETGETIDTLEPLGRVKVRGEIWNAHSISGNIGQGKQIRVVSMKNLTLMVEEIDNG